jgi:hypothetical protein
MKLIAATSWRRDLRDDVEDRSVLGRAAVSTYQTTSQELAGCAVALCPFLVTQLVEPQFRGPFAIYEREGAARARFTNVLRIALRVRSHSYREVGPDP